MLCPFCGSKMVKHDGYWQCENEQMVIMNPKKEDEEEYKKIKEKLTRIQYRVQDFINLYKDLATSIFWDFGITCKKVKHHILYGQDCCPLDTHCMHCSIKEHCEFFTSSWNFSSDPKTLEEVHVFLYLYLAFLKQLYEIEELICIEKNKRD